MEAETMCSGREFQIWVAATGKARLPTVVSLTGGTTRRLTPAERSACWSGTSAIVVNGQGQWYASLSALPFCLWGLLVSAKQNYYSNTILSDVNKTFLSRPRPRLFS